jgi:hypothetical protein
MRWDNEDAIAHDPLHVHHKPNLTQLICVHLKT